jgi:hypothetical protein
MEDVIHLRLPMSIDRKTPGHLPRRMLELRGGCHDLVDPHKHRERDSPQLL